MESQASSEAINALGAQIVAAIAQAAIVPADQKLVKKEWIGQYFGVRATACEKIISQPSFPRAVKVPGGALRWVQSEVVEWALEQRR